MKMKLAFFPRESIHHYLNIEVPPLFSPSSLNSKVLRGTEAKGLQAMCISLPFLPLPNTFFLFDMFIPFLVSLLFLFCLVFLFLL